MTTPIYTSENLRDTPDLMAQINTRLTDAYIVHERETLAAICGPATAWAMYPPLPSDDPADYAPYWVRMVDIIDDEDQQEAIVAKWWER